MTTYIELQKQIAELQQKAAVLKEQERQGVIDRMKEAIAVYGITATDLGLGRARAPASESRPAGRGAGRKAARSAAYADGNGNVWSGRGPRPRWLKEAIAGGSTLESFANSGS